MLAAAVAMSLLVAPAALAAGGAPAHVTGHPGPGEPMDVDGDCHDDLPPDVDLPRGPSVRVSVLLAYDDGISRARAGQVAAAITRIYAPAGLTAPSIGLTDCIGGIRDRRRAFSVSEMSPKVRGITLGPVTGSGDEEARSAAHEIGHLLGARHEHANCAEGAPASRTTDSTCTIMFLAAPSSDVLGQVEAAVMRSYARKYAG